MNKYDWLFYLAILGFIVSTLSQFPFWPWAVTIDGPVAWLALGWAALAHSKLYKMEKGSWTH